MNVRHGQRPAHNSGQERHVHGLLDGEVAHDLLHQRAVGINQRVGAHAGLLRTRHQPAILIQLLELAEINSHFVPFQSLRVCRSPVLRAAGRAHEPPEYGPYSRVRFELCYSESSIRAIVSAPECLLSGRSAAWLARLVRDQEAGGSNPLAPTIFSTRYLNAPGFPSTHCSQFCAVKASSVLNGCPEENKTACRLLDFLKSRYFAGSQPVYLVTIQEFRIVLHSLITAIPGFFNQISKT